MSYTLKLYAMEDVSPEELRAAEQRFKTALEAELGDANLVAPVHAAYQRIVLAHGEAPDPDTLSPHEHAIFTQWQAAESAAVIATWGPNRYLGDAQFDIRP
ncbi:MAG: hypothetical protein WA136_02075 [Rhodoferax sp.]